MNSAASLPASASSDQSDPALGAFLGADPSDAGAHLEALVSRDVIPLVHRVVRQRLLARGSFRHRPEDIEDIQAEAVSEIVARLRDLRDAFDSQPIVHFAAYVAVTAQNACYRFIRSRSPHRARLKNRLRYLFSHDPTLALWQDASGEWLCGRRVHEGMSSTIESWRRLQDFARDAGELRRQANAAGNPTEIELARFLVGRIDTGVYLDDLAGLVAELLNLNDREPDDHQGAIDLRMERLREPGPSVLTTMADRQQLQRLWREILELPLRQRLALLLNLRDPEGGGILPLLPLTGTATLRQIAAGLEMSAPELAEIWNQLPIEDARIAERLGMTRQQVINLRKSARERLSRRTAKIDPVGNMRSFPSSLPNIGDSQRQRTTGPTRD